MADDAPLNTASARSVRIRRKRVGLQRRRELDDLEAVLRDPAAKRLLWRVLERCGVFTQVDVENTNRVLHHEGKRTVGLWLIAELEAADLGAIGILRAALSTPTEGTS